MTTSKNSQPEPPPEQLCKIEGIAGILLQDEGRIIVNDFPLLPAQTELISVLARKMCQGFRNARRVLRQIIIGYPNGQLLVLSRDDTQMVLLLLEDASLNVAAEKASAYLNQRLQKPIRLPSAPAA